MLSFRSGGWRSSSFRKPFDFSKLIPKLKINLPKNIPPKPKLLPAVIARNTVKEESGQDDLLQGVDKDSGNISEKENTFSKIPLPVKVGTGFIVIILGTILIIKGKDKDVHN